MLSYFCFWFVLFFWMNHPEGKVNDGLKTWMYVLWICIMCISIQLTPNTILFLSPFLFFFVATHPLFVLAHKNFWLSWHLYWQLASAQDSKMTHFSPTPTRSYREFSFSWSLTKCKKKQTLTIFKASIQKYGWMLVANKANPAALHKPFWW